ncbi:hypothetical protein ASC80_05110 [Afipia sp. Root123D2]|uniref:hypothetical protein n=1 Tax=Afipia sp. Root123D2 TaxID=1736436 RepID=UPI0006FF4A19|nr:hypothetical protein [Afipia sp. Root123D2]KQW22729.1 hypothetical protein ASC80_05110 [Afipia sp. Root123D2]
MIGPQLLKRAGIAFSVAAHAAVVAWVIFGSGVRLFDPAPAEAITVDLVSPDEAKAPPGNGDGTTPEESKKDDAESQSIVPGSSAQATPDLPAQQSPPTEQAKEPAEEPIKEQVTKQATVQSPPPPPAIPRAEPDITEKYGTMFSLSDSGYTPTTTAAQIPEDAVSKFRAHLRTCAKLPENVSSGDDVRVVLRIGLLPSGNLSAAPALIEASASAKGPLLMQAAIKALQACQPYNMLPADKYPEWRVLNLPFTPQDFSG